MGSIPVTLVIFFKSTRYEIYPSSKTLPYKVNIKALKLVRKKELKQWRPLKVKGPFFKRKVIRKKLTPIFSNNNLLPNLDCLDTKGFGIATKLVKTFSPDLRNRTLYASPKPFRGRSYFKHKPNLPKALQLKFYLDYYPYINRSLGTPIHNYHYLNLLTHPNRVKVTKMPKNFETCEELALRDLLKELKPIKPLSNSLFWWNILLEKEEVGLEPLGIGSENMSDLNLNLLKDLGYRMSKLSPPKGPINPLLTSKRSFTFSLLRRSIFKKTTKTTYPKAFKKFLFLEKIKKNYSSRHLKAPLKRLYFLRNSNLKGRPRTITPKRFVQSPLRLFFKKPLNTVGTLPNNPSRGSVYNNWSDHRKVKLSLFSQKLLFRKFFLFKRKSHPHIVKPWLFDLVLNPKLSTLEDKGASIRESIHTRASENPVNVGGKEFMTLDEDWIGSKLQRFHQKTSNRYLFLNNHIDSLRLWDSPNFVFTQEADPSIRVKNPDSYLSHYHLPTKFTLTFFKKVLKKKVFINYFKSILKNFDKAMYKSYSYIRYPSFKRRLMNRSSPNIINLSYDKLGEDFQIKSKFGRTLVLHSILKLKKKLPLKLLLLSMTNSDMRSLLFIDFSYKDPLFFIGRAHLFFMKSLIKNSPNFNLEDLLIPISLLSTNNLMSSPVQFFNENRGSLQPLKTSFLLKSPGYTKGTQPQIKKQFRHTHKSLGSFYTRYLPYLLFRINIRQNPIRRPLYSTFLASSKILKTHSFRISLNKNTPSLTKYPVSTLNSQAHLLSSSNLLKFSFLYTNSDNLFEVNINNSLNSYATNYLSFKRSLITPALFSHNLNLGDKLQPSIYGSLGSLKTCEKKRNELSLWLFIDSTVNPVYNLFNLPFLYKFFFWNYQLLYGRPNMSIDFNWSFFLKKFSNNLLVPNRISRLTTTNIIPLGFFKSSVKKRVVKTLSNDIYIPRTTIYFYRTLINFIEYHTGKKVFLKLNPFLEGSLTFKDSCRCSIWYNKINIFQKILGHRIFVHESLRIFMAAVRFRDPTFLANWIRSMLYRMSFWKYRVLFRYIKYVFRALFLPYFDELDFKGVRLVVRGKISVAGNARARTLAFSVGNTSNSEFNNRVLSSFNTIDSFTGVMGFRLTFYF